MASKLNTMRSCSANDFIIGHKLEVQVLLPDVKGGDEEIVHRGDAGGLQQQLGLRAALLAGDQDFGDGGGFGERELAVLLGDEVAAQWDEEQQAETASREADEDALHRMRVEVQDVQRRQREHCARDDGGRGAADAGEDDVFQHGGAAAVEARQSNGEDGDGDCRLHALADLQRRVRGSDAEDDAQHRSPEHRAPSDFRHAAAGGHQRDVEFTLFQRFVGVRRKTLDLEFVSGSSHECGLRRVYQPEAL